MGSAATHIRQWWSPRRWWSGLFPARPKHPFDRAHGVDTGGLIYANAAAEGHASGEHNAGYYATAPSLFHGAIALWRETLPGTGYRVEDHTLVDIGCGKGRVLMLATEYAFREIVGVELDPGLARVAGKNLRKWMIRTRAPARVRIIEGDALEAPLPDGPVAVFYFNSFERAMIEMWLERLGDLALVRTAPLDLIYIHPEFDGLVRQVPGMRSLAATDIPLSNEDAQADAFGVTSDECAIYRLGR